MEISAPLRGLDGIDADGPTEGTYERGGGGARQGTGRTGYTEARASFTCDETDENRPLLAGHNGETLYVRVREDGTGPGLPQESFSGPAQINHTMAGADRRRFTVNIEINGAIGHAVQ